MLSRRADQTTAVAARKPSQPPSRYLPGVLTGELKSRIDRIWDAFWAGGIANPLEVMEQITYLLFVRRLDDLQTARERRATRAKAAVKNPIFPSGKRTRLALRDCGSAGSPSRAPDARAGPRVDVLARRAQSKTPNYARPVHSSGAAPGTHARVTPPPSWRSSRL